MESFLVAGLRSVASAADVGPSVDGVVALVERPGITAAWRMTVRERVRKIQADLRDGALTPDMARESLVQLTALLGNVADEQRKADVEYKQILLIAMQSEMKANRARIVAETSPQYLRAREAKDTATLVTEMIRSCRAYLRSLDEEMRLSGH